MLKCKTCGEVKTDDQYWLAARGQRYAICKACKATESRESKQASNESEWDIETPNGIRGKLKSRQYDDDGNVISITVLFDNRRHVVLPVVQQT